MTVATLVSRSVLLAGVVTLPVLGQAVAWRAHDDFMLATNPNGAWSYGTKTSPSAGALCLYTATTCSGGNLGRYHPSTGLGGCTSAACWPTVGFPMNSTTQLVVHPKDDPSIRYSTVRWAAPYAATFHMVGGFTSDPLTSQVSTDVHVVVPGLPGEVVTGYITQGVVVPIDIVVTMQAGTMIDFTVGDGGNGDSFDHCWFDVVIQPLAVLEAPALSPIGSALVYALHGPAPTIGYVLDCSLTGSVPGFTISPGGIHIPLNPPLVYATYGTAFSGVFMNFLGFLDWSGGATATIAIPMEPAIIGAQISASFVTIDPSAPYFIGSVANATTTTIAPTGPMIGTLAPASGPAAGGTPVTITGVGFAAGAQVRFGGAIASNVSSTPTTITCTTPAGASGAVDVRVDNPNGFFDTKPGAYTYVPTLVVSGVSPLTAAAGQLVTIAGAGMQAGLSVSVGGIPAQVVAVTPAQTTFLRPAGIPCGTAIVATNPDLQAASIPFNPPIAVSGTVGANGPAAGGTQFFVIGGPFFPGTTATIGGNAATVLAVSPNAMILETPPGVPGLAVVVVTSSGGCSASTQFLYL